MHTKRVLYFPLATVLLTLSSISFAGLTSTPIPVTATITQGCLISTTSALAFSAYDPIGTNLSVPLNATGAISVTCTKGATGLTIGMDLGSHVAGAQRQMIGTVSTNLLSYNIFQPPSGVPGTACTFPGTTAWTTTGSGLLTLPSPPSNVARLFNVCGTIPAGQNVSADAYADTVNATINF